LAFSLALALAFLFALVLLFALLLLLLLLLLLFPLALTLALIDVRVVSRSCSRLDGTRLPRRSGAVSGFRIGSTRRGLCGRRIGCCSSMRVSACIGCEM
jgi:hypothetical protein